jgi:NSS family neurotransmitter:Na+ symporter
LNGRRCDLGEWRARTTFVLALAAAAVGLGNLWRFPYLLGTQGGGAFMLTYLACLFLVAVPVMIAEVIIGTQGRAAPVGALRWSSDRSLLSRGWVLLGVFHCVTGPLVLAYLAVIAGWILAYAYYLYSGVFSAASATQVGAEFQLFLADPVRLGAWQAGFLLLVGVPLSLGVRRGLGPLVWLVIPVFLSLLLFLGWIGFEQGDAARAGEFLFSVKRVDFTPQSVLLAIAHAFFTLGVGLGVGITFGAYAPRRLPVGRSVLAVAVFDTLVALLAGLAIYPLVFASNMAPASGPALLFVGLPYAFGNMLQGDVLGALFFLMAALATLGTGAALMEPAVGAVCQWLKVRRPFAVLVVLAVVWGMGLAIIRALVTGEGAGWYGGRNLLEFFDWMAAALLLPLVSLLTVLFAGWRLRPEILRDYFGREGDLSFAGWRLLVRYVAPAVIGLIALSALLPLRL